MKTQTHLCRFRDFPSYILIENMRLVGIDPTEAEEISKDKDALEFSFMDDGRTVFLDKYAYYVPIEIVELIDDNNNTEQPTETTHEQPPYSILALPTVFATGN